jgi:uncharacterized secreted protein with C-terminal beta-propeller domain
MTVRRLPSLARRRPQLETLEDRCLLTSGGPVQFGSADAFIQYLINQAETRYQGLFGQHFSSGNFVPPGSGGVVAYDASVPTSAVTAQSQLMTTGGNASFSQTNVQVAGVNEADIVKTDGNYIYYVHNQQLVIAQAWPANSLSIVSSTPLDGDAIAEYLNGTRLTVLSTVYNYGYGTGTKVDPVIRTPDGFPLIYPTYTKTEVTIYDVSNPASPVVVESTYMDGNYVTSREVGSTVYVVQQNYFAGLPAPAYTSFNGDTIYESLASYLARISGHELDLALPHFYTRTDASSPLTPAGFLTDPAQVYEPMDSNDYDMTSIVAFDVTGTSPTATVSLFTSYAAAVYASQSNLYVAVPHWNYPNPSTSEIYQFNLNGTQVSLGAAGSVSGQAFSQFSFDENGNYLRVVTTSYGASTTDNALYVLTAQNGVLTVVGTLDNLAPGGWIEAVRFNGDEAFISTNNWNAQNGSPLLAVDVSDPTAPILQGAVSLPGFVTYFQPIDATHMVGIGRQIDSITGVYQLEAILFDFSDPTVPRVVDQAAIDPSGWNWWWGGGSEAEWDPHALGYFPEYQTFAIPVYGSYTAPDWTGFQSQLWVFQVDPNTGFTLLGTVQHDSQVRRSLRIGDQLYSIADDSIQVHPIADPSAPGTEARITDDPRFPIYYPYYASPGIAYSGRVLTFSVSSATALSATISWGDGTTSPGSITGAGGSYAVVGTHTYSVAGNYTPTVSFSRSGTAVNSLTGTVNVTNLPVSVADYVDHLYQDLLGRHAEMGGLESWGRQLMKGSLTREQIAAGIIGSVEYRSGQIDHLYATLLGRKADEAGLKSFLAALGAGATLIEVEAVILGSPEYFHHAGGSVGTFLKVLYHDVLERAVDPAGASSLGAALTGSLTTRQVAALVLASPEAENDVVQSLYQLAFERSADPNGLYTYTNALGHGISEEAVMASLFGSQEYMNRVTA